MNFSKRIQNMQSSPIRRLVPIANEAKRKGKKVYHLNIGQPDIKTPKAFFDSVSSFKEEVLEYSASQGDPELIQSIIDYYKTYNMNFEDDEILITNGGSEALLFTMLAVLDSGDSVVVPEPFYPNYKEISSVINVETSPIITKAEEGFHLPPKSEVIKSITPNTRAILLSHPGNPTGVVYTKEEVKMIAEIALEYDLFIVADEVYREFVYDGFEYISFGNVEEIQDRVVIIDSISKRYSACGARIGSIASKNKDLIAQILKLCQGRLCVPTLEQKGAVELYKTPMSYFKEVNAEYTKRRDILFEELSPVEGIVCKKSAGAFYSFVKLPVENAEDFVIWMLRDFDVDGETVMMAPGEGFYSTPGLGRDEVRIAYVLNEYDLRKSMHILKAGLKKYKSLNPSHLSDITGKDLV